MYHSVRASPVQQLARASREPRKPGTAARAVRSDEAVLLLDDLIIALTNLPDDVFFELSR
jgi:hypothetical protein